MRTRTKRTKGVRVEKLKGIMNKWKIINQTKINQNQLIINKKEKMTAKEKQKALKLVENLKDSFKEEVKSFFEKFKIVLTFGQGCFMLNFKDKNMTASCSFLLTQHSNFAKKCERQAPLRVDALNLGQNFR